MVELKGAIFDLDGTVLDSMGVWNGFGERYLATLGIQAKPDLESIIHTLSIWEAAEYFQKEYQVEKPAEIIVAEINRMIEEAYFYHIQAKDGAKEFLQILHEKGVKMCVATATDRYQVEAVLKREGMLDWFERIFTCSEVGVGKQEPEIYLQALEYLNTPKEKTWIFEDMLYAVKTAVQAGFSVVAVQDMYSLKDEAELRVLSSKYITHYHELEDFFVL